MAMAKLLRRPVASSPIVCGTFWIRRFSPSLNRSKCQTWTWNRPSSLADHPPRTICCRSSLCRECTAQPVVCTTRFRTTRRRWPWNRLRPAPTLACLVRLRSGTFHRIITTTTTIITRGRGRRHRLRVLRHRC
uniref:(northern house mosquito) hypothetical protein n=1 Tax=Culex pipiens TaxID=7175 RepID=A0A8D8G3Z9_CULPI